MITDLILYFKSDELFVGSTGVLTSEAVDLIQRVIGGSSPAEHTQSFRVVDGIPNLSALYFEGIPTAAVSNAYVFHLADNTILLGLSYALRSMDRQREEYIVAAGWEGGTTLNHISPMDTVDEYNRPGTTWQAYTTANNVTVRNDENGYYNLGVYIPRIPFTHWNNPYLRDYMAYSKIGDEQVEEDYLKWE